MYHNATGSPARRTRGCVTRDPAATTRIACNDARHVMWRGVPS